MPIPLLIIDSNTPRVLKNPLNINPPLHITIQHLSNQINAILAHNIRYPQIMVHNLVNTVERVLFVHDGIQEDAQSPNILLLSSVRVAAKDFGGGVVYDGSLARIW